MTDTEEHALERRARRAARRIRLIAHKSRWRKHTCDNYGGFMLRDPKRNRIVCGVSLDMTAEQAIEYCERLESQRAAA